MMTVTININGQRKRFYSVQRVQPRVPEDMASIPSGTMCTYLSGSGRTFAWPYGDADSLARELIRIERSPAATDK